MSSKTSVILRLNNNLYEFIEPLTIFQACLTKKIFLPRFCYHVDLKIAGNCRMCLVEEKSALKPLASCAVTITNSHIIYTNTETVKKAREGVPEYLSINHPLDCPICDQGGECDSQDQTLVFGADRGRFYENKRSTPNKNLGFLIKTFLNRCIHRSRCTRFLNEIAGTDDLQLLGRGLKTEISNYVYKFIKSEISGNTVDLCPVGALTSKPYAFKARPWELLSVYTYDLLDGFGSNIQIDFRGLDLMRILPRINRFLNEEWISDKTRFSYDSFNMQRLTNSFLKNSNIFKKLNWLQNLILVKNIFFASNSELQIAVNFGNFLDYETSLATKNLISVSNFKLFNNQHYKNINKDFRKNIGLTNLYSLDMNNKDTENINYIILNSNLRFESPILNLKLRKIFSNYENTIFIVGFLSNFNFDFIHLDNKFRQSMINLSNQKNKLILTTEQLFFDTNIDYVVDDITKMIKNDSNLFTFFDSKKFDFVAMNIGEPESLLTLKKYFFEINLLHHIEDIFVNETNSVFKLLLPTSFFLEKTTTYINNSFIYLNTLSQFSIKLPNTKPEWKIISAFNEISNNISVSVSPKTFISDVEMRLKNFFELVNKTKKIYYSSTKKFSLINNFYLSNLISRLSSVMNLCSARLTIINDYIFVSYQWLNFMYLRFLILFLHLCWS